jgi:hypothetical protein
LYCVPAKVSSPLVTQNRILEVVTNLSSKISTTGSSSSNSSSSSLQSLVALLPLKTMEEVQAFNTLLESETNDRDLVSHLKICKRFQNTVKFAAFFCQFYFG